MFQKLYRFIQGDNVEEVVMKMTVPVFTFSHLNTENTVDKITMCFWINQINQVETEPKKFLTITVQPIKTAAEPKPNSEVSLWKMNPTSFFVSRFAAPGGFGHWVKWEEELRRLRKVLLC